MTIVLTSDQSLKSATAYALDLIREAVLKGDLPGGTRIAEAEIAASIGVSRTPVREALRQLVNEGLVEVRPRVGWFIRAITPDEVREVYALKAAIEPMIARWAAQRSVPADRAQLAYLLSVMDAAIARGDVATYTDCVDQFHNIVFQLARAPIAQSLWSLLTTRVKRLRRANLRQAGRIHTSYDQHRAIAEAILAQDGERAAAEMAAHIADAERSILATLCPAPESDL